VKQRVGQEDEGGCFGFESLEGIVQEARNEGDGIKWLAVSDGMESTVLVPRGKREASNGILVFRPIVHTAQGGFGAARRAMCDVRRYSRIGWSKLRKLALYNNGVVGNAGRDRSMQPREGAPE
jgi:hypothetical protein